MNKKKTEKKNELGKYVDLKEKLSKVCRDNNLVCHIKNNGYPFLLTIKPQGGMDAQQTMLEGMDNPGETGYISPDASLVFAYRDGEMSYKISETFTISDSLFSKIKGIFNKLHAMWMMYFFRDVMETSPGMAIGIAAGADAGAKPTETTEGEDTADEFADFLDEAEDAVEDEDTEEELHGDDAEAEK